MSVSVAKFIQHVKVKLNRLDTSQYEDVRPEEVVFFANDALKALTLAFDKGLYPSSLDLEVITVYLASLHSRQTELPLTNNERTLSQDVFKFKDMQAYVTIKEEQGWQDTRWLDNKLNSFREENPFTKSYPDRPIYRLIEDKIKFEAPDFEVTKIRYEYLKYPITITEAGTLEYLFINELEDKTVTLILENLESRRIQSQPSVSRS